MLSRNLTVHFKKMTYLVEPGPNTLPFAGKSVRVHEWEDGRVEIHGGNGPLPHSIFFQTPNVAQGAVVENKRLGAALAAIQTTQIERDRMRLESKKITIRTKDRIRTERNESNGAAEPNAGRPNYPDAVVAFLQRLEMEERSDAKRATSAPLAAARNAT